MGFHNLKIEKKIFLNLDFNFGNLNILKNIRDLPKNYTFWTYNHGFGGTK